MRAIWLVVCVAAMLQSPKACMARQTERLPESGPEAAVSKGFEERAKDYVSLQKKLEGELPALKTTDDATEIASHQVDLTLKLLEARKNARQGDLFTPEAATQFKKTIRVAYAEPGGQTVRRTVTEGDTPKAIVVKVNAKYPSDSPVQTTPPTLLNRLPKLPMELAYRIVGRSLLLLDNKTNLIVDFIPDAIP